MPVDGQPIWSRCLCLAAGLCPELLLRSPELCGAAGPRPELTQDLALASLGDACLDCRLAPDKDAPC